MSSEVEQLLHPVQTRLPGRSKVFVANAMLRLPEAEIHLVAFLLLLAPHDCKASSRSAAFQAPGA